MTRYDFQEAWRVTLKKVYKYQFQLDLISRLVNLLDELGQMMVRYDFLEAMRVILSNVQTWPNFKFGSTFI